MPLKEVPSSNTKTARTGWLIEPGFGSASAESDTQADASELVWLDGLFKFVALQEN